MFPTTSRSNTLNSLNEWLSMIGPAIGWMGVSVAWSLQKGYGTTVLLKLDLDKNIVNYIWLAGPISGIIVQPLIGSCSDKCNTRRPFIIFGCIAIMINLWIFSNTKYLYQAIYIFWLNDFCINILMVPLRALSSDNVSSSKQMDSMAWFSIFGSIGSSMIFYIATKTDDVSMSYFIGNIIILCTTIIALLIDIICSKKRRKNMDDINMRKSGNINFIKRIYIKMKTMPLFIWKIMHVQFWSFAAFYPFWIYLPTFYSENIMNGELNEERKSLQYIQYQRGIKYSNFGYEWNSIIMVIASFLIPKIFRNENKKIIKICWIISYLFCSLFLILTPLFDDEKYLNIFVVFHALCGITSAVMEIFPWQIASSYTSDYDQDNKALILTIVNLAVCISQIFVALTAGHIIKYFNNNLSGILFFAGICKLIASVCVYFVDLEFKQKQSSD